MNSSRFVFLLISIYFTTHMFAPLHAKKDEWGDAEFETKPKSKTQAPATKPQAKQKPEVEEDIGDEEDIDTEEDSESQTEEEVDEEEEDSEEGEEVAEEDSQETEDEASEEDEDTLEDEEGDEDEEEAEGEPKKDSLMEEDEKEASPLIEIKPETDEEPTGDGIYDGLTPTEMNTIRNGYKGKVFEETLTDGEWENIIGNNEDVYIVEPGDTLWEICNRLLANPYHWPKLWQLNKYIANPHFIYPGDELHFFAGSDVEPPTLQIVKPGEKADEPITTQPETSSQGKSEIANEETPLELPKLPDPNASDFKYKPNTDVIKIEPMAYKINYKMTGIISESPLKEVGMILDAKTERVYLHVLDAVQLEISREVSLGDRFSIFREDVYVEHPITGRNFGYLNKILGEVIVTSIKDGIIKGTIISTFAMIKRGDLLTVGIPYLFDIKTRVSEQKVHGNIICFDESYYQFANAFQIVYIDLGADDGILEGNLFKIVRKQKLSEESYVSADDSFEEIMGSMIVLNVQKETSAALILKNKRPLELGDHIVMINSREELSPKVNKNLLSKASTIEEDDEEYEDEGDSEISEDEIDETEDI